MKFADPQDRLRDELMALVKRFKATLPEGITVSLDEQEVSDTEHDFSVFLTDERDSNA